MATVFRPPVVTRQPPLGPRQDWIQSSNLLLLVPGAGAKPFAQLDWPLPARRDSRQGWVQSSNFPLLIPVVAGVPFAQLDWPVPKGPAYPVALRTWLQSQNIAPSLIPAHQTDWPVPKGPRYPVGNLTWLQSLNAAPSLIPVHQLDWPVPRGPLSTVSRYRTETNRLPLTAVSTPGAYDFHHYYAYA